MRKLGQYDYNTINTGNAVDFLRTLPDDSVPMFLFSPPYNLGTTTGGGFGKAEYHQTETGKRRGSCRWSGGSLAKNYTDHDDAMPPAEYTAWQKEILAECWRSLADNGAIYYNHKPAFKMVFYKRRLTSILVCPCGKLLFGRAGGINYSPSFYLPTHEWIVIYAKPNFRLKSKAASEAGDVWYIPQESGTWHPAPFPEALVEMALETVMPSLIVDPFSGSGTVAAVAKRLGINYVCNEKSAEYVSKSLRRLDKVTHMPKLLDAYADLPATMPLFAA